MTASSVPAFCDAPAPDYHRIFGDWDASMAHPAAALDAVAAEHLRPGPHRVLDCACGPQELAPSADRDATARAHR
ncbi:hypothetical protein [Streptomyces beihaiensis]|uniref:SAM-dependent methyltransferase n=1 Tax=Streptomyces beihaiensis TaxID=2984495 RepID=A0ABT3U1B8_9ACTN|nr:hypothetical protein [Streptomyces beihaiensis]MCX3062850.1 hypothetical protein [Streptomyces beihaiensis]